MKNKKGQFEVGAGFMITIIVVLMIVALVGLAYGSKIYKVWALEQDGKAELAKAQWEKQIAIEVAKAEKESAILYAEAEVERAKGVAQANEIIANGLKDNEEYLRYLWINQLGKNNQDVIYIPTEAGMPILEATRGLQNGN